MPKSIRKLQEEALIALRTVAREAVAENTRAGLPVYVWKDGKVVDLNARKRQPGLKRPSKAARSKKK